MPADTLTLFEADTNPALNAELINSISAEYIHRLLLNPPTPSFNVTVSPKAETFAGFAARKDIARFLAVLDDLGLTITQKSSE